MPASTRTRRSLRDAHRLGIRCRQPDNDIRQELQDRHTSDGLPETDRQAAGLERSNANTGAVQPEVPIQESLYLQEHRVSGVGPARHKKTASPRPGTTSTGYLQPLRSLGAPRPRRWGSVARPGPARSRTNPTSTRVPPISDWAGGSPAHRQTRSWFQRSACQIRTPPSVIDLCERTDRNRSILLRVQRLNRP
jgi:hypothetical protein